MPRVFGPSADRDRNSERGELPTWRVRPVLALLVALAALALPANALASSTAPVVVGAVSNNTSLSGALATAVAGNHAYTAAGDPGQLTAVDFSNPAAPTISGSTPATGSLESGTNLAIAGNFAFVVSKNQNASTTSNDDGNGNSLTVVDISNPANPSVVGTVHDSAKLFGNYGVAVSGHYAFIAYQGLLSGQPSSPDTSTGGFSVIDLNNLGAGVVANIDNGSLPSPYTGTNALRHATSVAISGNYAYVTAFYSSRVTVINISNPTSPTIAGSVSDSTNLPWPVDAAVDGNYLYVANQAGGLAPELTVLDISKPAQPAIVGTLSDNTHLNNAYRIRARGNFAYISAPGVSTVAAIDVSDPAHPRLAGYVQDAAHLFRTTGLDLDPTGRYVVANSYELSTETGLNPTSPYPPFTNTTGTISVIDLVPNPIGVHIAAASEPSNPTSQTAANFTFATTDDVSTVACSLDGAPYGPCSSPTTESYSGLAMGSHTFTVQTTDAAGNTSTDSYTWKVVPPPPTNTSPPTITGSVSRGQTLNVTQGAWTNSPTSYSYQWEDCDQSGNNCQPIQGATGQSYTLGAGDVGHTIVVGESATNSGGTGGPVSSAATGIVTGPPVSTSPPAVSGSAAPGQTLSVSNGTWSGYPAPAYTYQWQDCPPSGGGACSPVGSATGSTYTVQASDIGFALEVVVTASNGIGQPVPVSSTPSAIVVGQPASSSPPTISGKTTEGSTLTESHGSWTNAPTSYSYQWEDCDSSGGGCVAIAGAVGPTYTLGAADVGHTVRVLESAGNAAGIGGPASSASTAVVQPGSGPPSTPPSTPPPSSPPPQTAPSAPNPAQILSALSGVLSPRGNASHIKALLRTGFYKFLFSAPSAGSLSLSWYRIPKGAHLTSKRHSKPVLVATVTVSFGAPGKTYIALGLTQPGRSLLAHAKLLTLTAKASFIMPGSGRIAAPAKTFTLRR